MSCAGIKALEKVPGRNLLMLQTAYNNLGIGALDHQKDVEALEYLLKAEALYQNQFLVEAPKTLDGIQAATALQTLRVGGIGSESTSTGDEAMELEEPS